MSWKLALPLIFPLVAKFCWKKSAIQRIFVKRFCECFWSFDRELKLVSDYVVNLRTKSNFTGLPSYSLVFTLHLGGSAARLGLTGGRLTQKESSGRDVVQGDDWNWKKMDRISKEKYLADSQAEGIFFISSIWILSIFIQLGWHIYQQDFPILDAITVKPWVSHLGGWSSEVKSCWPKDFHYRMTIQTIFRHKHIMLLVIEGSLEVKLPTIWTDEKQGRGREKRKIRREKIRRERVRGQKIQMREKVGKSRNTVFFQWFVAPEGRKVGSLKRRVRTQLATGTMKNCTPLWREAHFQVKTYKTHQVRTTFWKLWCRKSARRCGAKMREAHFQVKMYKTPQRRTTFGSWDVEKVHAVVARSTFPSQKC